MSYIIQSLLDIDFYKFSMGQLVFHRYPDIPVTYVFTNRTKGVNLAEYIKEDDLRKELDHARSLSFTNSDLHYLRGTNEYEDRMFKEDYLEFLRGLHLPAYNFSSKDGEYHFTFPGSWAEAIYWETLALSVISELYYRSLMRQKSSFERDTIYAMGKIRLADKIAVLKKYPILTFSDFGTRRRFSRKWHEYVVKTLTEEFTRKQFVGTSNVCLANEYDLMPIGTSAHEMYMVMAGIMCGSDDEIRRSHNKVLQDWWDEYGWGLSIALTDTYTSDFFFNDMTREQAILWKGLRQDSGDTIAFGEKVIRFYERHGVDPREKMIVFSDGLDVAEMIRIAEKFSGRIKFTFGWGTNLTNDLSLPPLSLVIKVQETNGRGVVKLSDNLAKATGTPENIERFKKIFGCTGDFYKECTY